MKATFHSIRWRVQAWHGLILLLVVAASCLSSYQLAFNNQQRRIDRSVFEAEKSLVFGIFQAIDPKGAATRGMESAPPPPQVILQRMKVGGVMLPVQVAARFSGKDPGYAYFFVQASDGSIVFKSANIDATDILPSSRPGEPIDEVRTVGSRRESVRNLGHGPRMVVGRDITPEIEELRRFTLSLVAAGLGVWLVGLLGGWWLAGRAIKPIATISHTATRIAAGSLNERISTDGTDSELDQLSRVLNQTFDRLHQAFERQRQFTADASHELRTPVTILISETRRMLKRERTPEEYRAVMSTCLEAGERMQRLIESLLLLAHQENVQGGGTLPAAPCDLAVLAANSLTQLRPLADEKRITLQSDLKPALCSGNAAALSVLINNLVANALQHHPGPGCVTVECGHDAEKAFLSVKDDGPGIAADDVPHLFERFYRADKARSSASGHTGLGLAIAKTIADNHQGKIEVLSEVGRGSTFRVTLASGR